MDITQIVTLVKDYIDKHGDKEDKSHLRWLGSLQVKIIDRRNQELIKLVKSDEWPSAAPSHLICNENIESDKAERAESILDFFIGQNIRDKRFLDFGCGQGHVAKRAKNRGAHISVGYDIKRQWTEAGKATLVTDFVAVKKNAPYDIILLYDVIDHADDPLKMLKQVVSVANESTKIYMRAHPWCSRHGIHNYYGLNKAFMHLVFDEDILKELGVEPVCKQKVIHPIREYGGWIKEAGLKIKNSDVQRTSVEGFFQSNPLIKTRICSHWADSSSESARKWPVYQMEQSFLDYTLILQ